MLPFLWAVHTCTVADHPAKECSQNKSLHGVVFRKLNGDLEDLGSKLSLAMEASWVTRQPHLPLRVVVKTAGGEEVNFCKPPWTLALGKVHRKDGGINSFNKPTKN